MKTYLSVLLSGLLLCLGCTSTPPQQKTEFLLRPQATGVQETMLPTVGLGRVEVAPYLDHAGIAFEMAPGEINIAEHHRWADPLGFAIRRYLQVTIGQAANLNIADSLTSGDGVETKIDVVVHQFHGSHSGQVILVAEWQIRSTAPESTPSYRQFSSTRTVARDGYAEVVRTHAELLDELAASIAAEIRRSE